MLFMTSNTRSGGVGQGRASFSAPRSGRSEAQSLDGQRSGGYSARNAQGLLLSTGSPRGTFRLFSSNLEAPCFP